MEAVAMRKTLDLLLLRIRTGDRGAVHAFYLLTAWGVLEYLRSVLPEEEVSQALESVYNTAFLEIAAGRAPPDVTGWLLELARACLPCAADREASAWNSFSGQCVS